MPKILNPLPELTTTICSVDSDVVVEVVVDVVVEVVVDVVSVVVVDKVVVRNTGRKRSIKGFLLRMFN